MRKKGGIDGYELNCVINGWFRDFVDLMWLIIVNNKCG